MKTLIKITVISILLSSALTNVNAASNAPVKKSKSGICHDITSSYYKRTKKYTEFTNIEQCLKSGGRRPKR